MADYFYHIPENPAPERSTSGYFAAHDGKRLRYGLFPATARPLKGTVVILPGRNECIEKYFETARDLAKRGFGSATFDWRGQGASDRLLGDAARGHVRSFLDYARDLDRFFAEIVLPDCRGPFYLLAHSTGATVALLDAAAMVNRVRRMVLIAPLLALYKSPLSMPSIGRLATALTFTGFGRRYIAGGRPRASPFADNVLTSDPVRYQRNAALYQAYPHLAVGGPTVAWIRAACQAASSLQTPQFLARMQIPTLIVAAGADRVVSNGAIEHFTRQLRVSSLLTIDGARHEILQEADFYREQFFAAFDAFIPGTNAPVA
ncbi:alpha/beta hydrolase [Pseudaminobacter arsenicus]|uniref:Alpha/beta hydrolase n=1 Tax=Borborobacter arsenicus TaxID=1851146 RepID=A0A432V609_9HYPH|nr:alpha/beta hydrolase [Pseudaminobacter arsenicus]RUM97585.1 alpha/beta hydrolase [Pseudaminobacter arsenicus]